MMAKDGYSKFLWTLVDALINAREELSQKVEILNQDPDPIVVEESKVISERIKEIEKIINQ